MTSDCVFCKIAAGESPAEMVMEDGDFVAFKDLHPVAPVHALVVPRVHITSLELVDQLGPDGAERLLRFVDAVARRLDVHETGYRVIVNSGPDAGQEVFHLHLHVVGGRRLGEMA